MINPFSPVDLVIPICTARAYSAAYDELRYVLRSFEAHFPQLGRVFIVGVDPPSWLRLDRVVHLPVLDDPATWRDFNIIRKIHVACTSGVSRNFIFSCDDEFVLRPSVPADFRPRTDGDLAAWSEEKWAQKLSRWEIWYRRMWRTAGALARRGRQVWHFDSHHPVLMDAVRFPQVVTDYGGYDATVTQGIGFCVNTLYFNAIGAQPNLARDLCRGSRLPTEDDRFWNVNDDQDWPAALERLRELFPEPSRFEA